MSTSTNRVERRCSSPETLSWGRSAFTRARPNEATEKYQHPGDEEGDLAGGLRRNVHAQARSGAARRRTAALPTRPPDPEIRHWAWPDSRATSDQETLFENS
jgi:hypothetical protein